MEKQIKPHRNLFTPTIAQKNKHLTATALLPKAKYYRTYLEPYLNDIVYIECTKWTIKPDFVDSRPGDRILLLDAILVSVKHQGENLPRGCVSAVCRDFLPVNDDKDDVIEIISKNAHVFIPRYVSEKYISTIDMLCNEDLASVNDTFRYALSNTVKYHVLKRNYEVLKDKSCLDTIKKSIVSILISLIKDGKIDEAVNLVSDYDFAKEISDILECVKKNKNITVVDYDAFLTKLKERRLIS